jgi:hypothetical protein
MEGYLCFVLTRAVHGCVCLQVQVGRQHTGIPGRSLEQGVLGSMHAGQLLAWHLTHYGDHMVPTMHLMREMHEVLCKAI